MSRSRLRSFSRSASFLGSGTYQRPSSSCRQDRSSSTLRSGGSSQSGRPACTSRKNSGWIAAYGWGVRRLLRNWRSHWIADSSSVMNSCACLQVLDRHPLTLVGLDLLVEEVHAVPLREPLRQSLVELGGGHRDREVPRQMERLHPVVEPIGQPLTDDALLATAGRARRSPAGDGGAPARTPTPCLASRRPARCARRARRLACTPR